MTLAIITDSAAQLPETLADRFGVEVVPIAITIDGTTYLEGIDLDADDYFAIHRAGVEAATTSQPAPGAFAERYERAQAAGATEILSIHVGADYSGTINSARIGADLVDVPVRIVDSGTASFGVAACVWEAAELRANGADPETIAGHIETLAPHITTSVLFHVFDYVEASGRSDLQRHDGEGIAVYAGAGADLVPIGTGTNPAELCELLARPFCEATGPIRVGVARADSDTAGYTEQLLTTLDQLDHVVEAVEYRVGPSIAVHSGPGTAGGFFWPVIEGAGA